MYSQKKVVIKCDTTVREKEFIIPYKNIEIVDARFDRSKIGSIYNNFNIFGYTLQKDDAIFPDSLAGYLPRFLQTFVGLDRSSGDSLLILIKRFRVADYYLASMQGNNELKLTFHISASFYAAHNGRYYKLFALNETTVNPVERVTERKTPKLTQGTRAVALAGSLYRLLRRENFRLDTTALSFTRADMEAGLDKRFNLLLYDTAKTIGLYKTFDEFKNNRPSITGIKLVFKNKNLSYATNSEGEKIKLTDHWGICDGKKNYMIFREEYEELIPVDKGFKILSYRTKAEFRGPTNFGEASTRYGLLEATFSKMGDGVRTPEYFDLNMDTGELYLEEVFGKSGVSGMQSQILK